MASKSQKGHRIVSITVQKITLSPPPEVQRAQDGKGTQREGLERREEMGIEGKESRGRGMKKGAGTSSILALPLSIFQPCAG